MVYIQADVGVGNGGSFDLRGFHTLWSKGLVLLFKHFCDFSLSTAENHSFPWFALFNYKFFRYGTMSGSLQVTKHGHIVPAVFASEFIYPY